MIGLLLKKDEYFNTRDLIVKVRLQKCIDCGKVLKSSLAIVHCKASKRLYFVCEDCYFKTQDSNITEAEF